MASLTFQGTVHALLVANRRRTATFLLVGLAAVRPGFVAAGSLTLEGTHVVPHVQSTEMRYRRETDFSLGARVELYLRNTGDTPVNLAPEVDVRVRGKAPAELVKSDEWAWHDFPPAWEGRPLSLPPGSLTVWSWNGKRAPWGTNTQAELTLPLPDTAAPCRIPVEIGSPAVWLSAVTFLSSDAGVAPDTLVFHLQNASPDPVRLVGGRLWLPDSNTTWRVLNPQQPWAAMESFPAGGVVDPGEKGGARVATGKLPLTYAAVEVHYSRTGRTHSAWAHLRIKREVFDIGGGWVASGLGSSNSLHAEAYLRTLSRMHVNSGMHQEVPGYTDTALFDRYPLKYMNRLAPAGRYDTDSLLPRIHAVEFLGEPQFGGGRPVPPMDVWRAFAPYQESRLPTSVTHSEERVWRFYAGLSDFPHYDAYRVTAPSPDAWGQYDRWGGQRIRWGAPLETIGDMSRSLRELNRPRPVAYWSQGPHDDWSGYGGRPRGSPTPDELRSQAGHALSCRITSLYWFNLSLKALVKFRDLIEPVTRVNREIRLIDGLLLEGDAYEYRRERTARGPAWDLASVAGPRGAVCFANDLEYSPDPDAKVFRFRPRDGEFRFRLPTHLVHPAAVFRVDADGVHDVGHAIEGRFLVVRDQVRVTGIYVAAAHEGLRAELHARHAEMLRQERALGFDPAGSDADFEVLKGLLGAGTAQK